MAGSRVALVADDQNLVRSVTAHLEKHLSLPIYACSFARINEYLDAQANGLLLLSAANEVEVAARVRLVQDVCLQKLLPTVVLLDAGANFEHLDHLDGYVSRRLHWPEDAALLTQVARELARAGEFPTARQESLEVLLTRRLLALTPSLLPLVERIALAANHDVTVLLNGETGTGKTYLVAPHSRIFAAQTASLFDRSLRRPVRQPGRK